VDESPSAIEPLVGKTEGAEALGHVARDDRLPFDWLYPWLLALAGIAITLLLTS